jgi:hypothetical protein
MPYNLVLNNSNIIGNNNSIFQYKFSQGSFIINEESEMCISNITIPFSWFNISKSYYNNATISYKFPNGSSNNTYSFTFPDGYYNISDLNFYLQQYMITQNQYFYNSTTLNNLYFIQIITNITYYSNQLIINPVPISLPNGYSLPPSVYINGVTYNGFNNNSTTNYLGSTGLINYYPNSQTTSQIIIPSYTSSTGSIGSILGFLAGTYPTIFQTSSYNVLSNTTPNITPVFNIIVRSSIINNDCATPSDILDVFTLSNTNFGSNINYTPSYEKWITVQSGIFQGFTLYLQDQNFKTLQANDPNTTISLLLRQGKTKKKIELLNKPLNIIKKHLEFKDEKGVLDIEE